MLPVMTRLVSAFARAALASSLFFLVACGKSSKPPLDGGGVGGRGPVAPVGSKLALIVGINDYKYDAEISDLQGTGNDVAAVEDVLKRRFGFADGDVVVLKDASATKDNVLRTFREHLIRRAGKESVAVFYYSGHGSQMWDSSGDESDGWDETLVMHDSGRSEAHENRDLSDDEFEGLIQELSQKTAHVTVILDSCHSGTAVRAPGIPRVAPRDERGRTGEPKTLQPVAGSARGAEGWRSASTSYVLISGARSDQYSYERSFEGKQMGALTWYLTRALWQSTPETTYRDIMERVAADVTATFPAQTPQIEGLQRDTVVFSREQLEPDPFFEVRADSREVELLAGAVHGVTAGSLFAAHPPQAKRFDGEPIARLEVTSAEPTRSRARVTWLKPGIAQVPDRARAVELEHQFSKIALRVGYEPAQESPELQAFLAALKAHRHLAVTSNVTEYDLFLSRTSNDQWVLERGTGERLGDPVSAGASGTAAIVERVLKWAKWYGLKDLENERSANGGVPPNISFVFREADTTRLEAGTTLRARLENRSSSRWYLSLLALGDDGSVSLLYPAPGAQEFIEPGGSWERPLVTCVPEGWKRPVRDILKVFLTREPVDLSFLQQTSVTTRGVGLQSDLDAVLEAMRTSTRGAGRSVRGVSVLGSVVTGGWATREVSFEVHPKDGAPACAQ